MSDKVDWKRCTSCGRRLNLEPETLAAVEVGDRPQLCMPCFKVYRKRVERAW